MEYRFDHWFEPDPFPKTWIEEDPFPETISIIIRHNNIEVEILKVEHPNIHHWSPGQTLALCSTLMRIVGEEVIDFPIWLSNFLPSKQCEVINKKLKLGMMRRY